MGPEYFMNLALLEAEKSRGKTFPNPPVGAVLVKRNSLVSKGSTRPWGGDHAEVQAIKKAGLKAHGCDLYVTLEPCSHIGKTPPCADLLIKTKIKRIFIGMVDPNPIVKGSGIKKLKRAGIIVQTRVMQSTINKFYLEYVHSIKKKRPFIYLKIAQSLEGSVNSAKGLKTTISHKEVQIYTHHLRNRVDAILIGGQTLRSDDPDLTPRLVAPSKRHYPECLVVSKTGRFSKNHKLFNSKRNSTTLIISSKNKKIPTGIQFVKIPKRNSSLIPCLLSVLKNRGYHSVLVEAGPEILTKWIESGLWDSFRVICSSKSLPRGQKWTTGLSSNWQENLKIGNFTQFKEDCVWEFLPGN